MGKTYFGVPRYYCILKLIPHVFCFRDLAPFRPAGAAVLQPAAGAPALAPAVSRPMSADAASPLSVVRGLFVAHPPSSQAAGRPALEVLTSAALDDLWKQGFAVLDSALDPAMAHCAGAEALVKEQQATGGFERRGARWAGRSRAGRPYGVPQTRAWAGREPAAGGGGGADGCGAQGRQ